MSNCLYAKLPNELLVQFYKEINKNIAKGILTEAMYHELELIKEVTLQRDICLGHLNNINEKIEIENGKSL